MTDSGDGRGILFPDRLPTFHRLPAPEALASLARWFWFPRWDLPDGEAAPQEVLPFPAANLVVQPDGVELSGPTTRASTRTLRGSGWAVGALLRPAALVALHEDPGALRDGQVQLDEPDLHATIVRAMTDDDREAGRLSAAEAFGAWLLARVGALTETGLRANAMEALIAGDREMRRLDDVAQRMGLSVRSVQRLSQRAIGLPPIAVIRRYRLQEAAQRVRDEPSTPIAEIAAELGYADQAHLAADFREVLGFSASGYRAGKIAPYL